MHPNLALFLFVIILFSWKYPIDGFFASGIRLDDVILLFAFFVVFIKTLKTKKIKYPTANKAIFIFSFYLLISGIFSFSNDTGVSIREVILYSLRHLEYSIAFFLGYYISIKKVDTVFKYYIIYLIPIVILQKLGYLSFSTYFDSSIRPTGNTGGPWELAVVVSFILIYLLRKKNFYFAGIAFAIVFLTQARITILSLFALALLQLSKYKKIKRNLTYIAIATVFLAIFVTSFLPVITSFHQRIDSLKETDFNLISENLFNSTTSINKAEYHSFDETEILINVSNTSGDASAFSRFSRWLLAISTISSHGIYGYMFGLGPSFFGNAVDGGLLRIFLTGGFIGVIIYAFYIRELLRMAKNNKFFSYVVFIYLSSSIFIDVNYGLKPNIILWFMIGLIYQKRKNYK